MLINALKMIKKDWYLLQLRQFVSRNIVLTLAQILVLLCELFIDEYY